MKKLTAHSELQIIAKRYVWWESSDWAFQHPEVFLANVMDIGTWDDIQLVRKILGDDLLRQVLREAPPGSFHQRSWDFWHLKLGISKIPPLPKRKFK